MTSLPASTFHFRRRGELREGFWADVVIFDPAKIQDTAEYKSPHHYPEGISAVLVNGTVVLQHGEHTGAKAGRALRND
jgi:N-acyl-D-amino-acid deacylase